MPKRYHSRGKPRVWTAGNDRRRAPLPVETDLAGRWLGDDDFAATSERLEGRMLLRAAVPRAEATPQQVARELRNDLLHDGAAEAEQARGRLQSQLSLLLKRLVCVREPRLGQRQPFLLLCARRLMAQQLVLGLELQRAVPLLQPCAPG